MVFRSSYNTLPFYQECVEKVGTSEINPTILNKQEKSFFQILKIKYERDSGIRSNCSKALDCFQKDTNGSLNFDLHSMSTTRAETVNLSEHDFVMVMELFSVKYSLLEFDCCFLQAASFEEGSVYERSKSTKRSRNKSNVRFVWNDSHKLDHICLFNECITQRI